MNKSRMPTWVGRSIIILALPVLAGCADFGCVTPGSRGGCGPGTVVLMGAALIVAAPFALVNEGIYGINESLDRAKEERDISSGKIPGPGLVNQYKKACDENDWRPALKWQAALDYTQTFISKGWPEDKVCHIKALINLGRPQEAAPLARSLPPQWLVARCDALVKTNQPVEAQAVCAALVLQDAEKDRTGWGMAMIGHSLLLQGRTEEAYVQYRHMASHDVNGWYGEGGGYRGYIGDCHRDGASSKPVLYANFNLFRQQGWQAEESTRAQAYLEELYCGLYDVHRLYVDALQRKTPEEQLVLRQQADAKAAELLQGDDLELVLSYEQLDRPLRGTTDEQRKSIYAKRKQAYARVAETLKPMIASKPVDAAK